VPLLGALVWLRGEMARRGTEEAARAFSLARLEGAGRERCEADPVHFGSPPHRRSPEDAPRERPEGRRHFGPPRAFFLRAYDAQFRAADPEAPRLEGSIRQALEGGAEVASASVPGGLLVAVRMPWDEGPCAIVAAIHPRGFHGEPLSSLLVSAVVLCGGFLLAVWLSAGPVVRRIRSLTADVRRSLAARYAQPVRVSGSDEVAELARAFNEAAREVRAQLLAAHEREETLRSFLANTTHDLMLPLTVLQGHLSRLKQAGGTDAAEVAAAAEEAEYVASLVHNLAAAAKLEGGEPMVERHAFDLSALVERIVERHRPVAAARGIAIEHAVPEAPLWVEGDVTLVEQAAGNLVHNAVRHNRTGGHVAVVLDEDGPGGFRLRVSDDGPGVPPEQMPRLGERRFRTDEARGRHPEGLGIGLSIALGVAERHGFALTFAPNEPAGLVAEIRGLRGAAPGPPPT
jgi:signal transduction histidine kinase